MKNIVRYIICSFFLVSSFSCEKVVDIDLEQGEPKLVIDAIIRWQKGTTGAEQIIKLSLTNDFYTSDVLPASGATVTITDSANQVYQFIEVPNTENYICTNFVPEVGEEYTLEVQYEGQIYTSTNALLASPSITHVTQEIIDVFGEEIIQIRFFFQDDVTTIDYYLMGVINPNKQIPEFGRLDDKYSQGQELFGFYGSSETEPGITLLLSVQEVNKGFYDYMTKLIATTDTGNPFATPPATLRGNILNETNDDAYPLGYFHLAEIDVVEYVVE